MVNIGCGSVFHPDWINVDLASHSPEVIACDLTKGLPFPNESVDVCYSSHVLEHLNQDEANVFLSDQSRVLRSGGIIRIAVPDLETICRNYLKYLDEAARGESAAIFSYDYSLLELFDQTVRTKSGGELRKVWEAPLSPAERKFVLERSGDEFLRTRTPAANLSKRPIGIRIRNCLSRTLLRLLHGRDSAAIFKAVLVRQSGEIHKAMYDRFSLSRLLKSHSFENPIVCAAGESRIPDFPGYELEIVGKQIRKPDSLFMEAVKPA